MLFYGTGLPALFLPGNEAMVYKPPAPDALLHIL